MLGTDCLSSEGVKVCACSRSASLTDCLLLSGASMRDMCGRAVESQLDSTGISFRHFPQFERWTLVTGC